MSNNIDKLESGMDKTIHLSINGLSLSIGGLKILNEISINIPKGSLFAIIGPNGAGKTSLLNCISGIYNPTSGCILFNGYNLARLKSYEVAKIGIARTFQHAELFRRMSVLDNILIGRHIKMEKGLIANGIFLGKTIEEEVVNREKVEKIIDFLELQKFRKSIASELPYGIQKIVGLGRALATEPKILLLDEPSAGMTRREKEDLAKFILRIKNKMGITMIWVEHDMQLVGDLSDYIAVLNFGTKIVEGIPNEVLKDQRVIEAYLGTKMTT